MAIAQLGLHSFHFLLPGYLCVSLVMQLCVISDSEQRRCRRGNYDHRDHSRSAYSCIRITLLAEENVSQEIGLLDVLNRPSKIVRVVRPSLPHAWCHKG